MSDAQKRDELIRLRKEVSKADEIQANFLALESQIQKYEDTIQKQDAKILESKTKADEARNEAAGFHLDLNRAAGDLNKAEDKVRTLTRQLEEKDAVLEAEREKLRRAQEKIAGKDLELKGYETDIPGLRAQMAENERAREAQVALNAQYVARIAELEKETAELASQKIITTVLTQQIEQQRTEMGRFPLDPQAFRTTTKDENGNPKPQANPLGNLEEELQEKTTSEEESSDSEDESDEKGEIITILRKQIDQLRMEMGRFNLDPQAHRTTSKEPQEKSEEESSESEHDTPPAPPGPSRIIRIIERIPTYYPYHVSDHSLPYCSFMTFVNTWVLINLWCREIWSRVGPTARKLFRIGLPGSQSPPQSPPHSPRQPPPPPPGGNGGSSAGNGSDNPAPPSGDDSGNNLDDLSNLPPLPRSNTGASTASDGTLSGSGSGNPPPSPSKNGNSGSKPASSEARPSDRHSSEASQSGSMNSDLVANFQGPAQNQNPGNAALSPSLMSSDEVMGFQGPPSNSRSGTWNEEGTPQSIQTPHMNVNRLELGALNSDDSTEGPDTPKSIKSEIDYSKFIDMAPDPPDTRVPLQQGGVPRPGSHPRGDIPSHAPPPEDVALRSRIRYWTAAEVEERFPLPDGAGGPVDNYIVNAPPAPPSPPDLWQLITHPDPSQRPSFWRTLRDLLFHILFFFALYMMWVIYVERQNWKVANNIARAFFDDLYQHRCHYGRGFIVKIVPEHIAVGIDRLFLYIGRLFGRQLKPYPIPG